MENPVKIFSSNQIVEVELLKAKLETAGIGSYLLNKQDSAYVVIGEVELHINNADIEKAKVIVNDFINNQE